MIDAGSDVVDEKRTGGTGAGITRRENDPAASRVDASVDITRVGIDRTVRVKGGEAERRRSVRAAQFSGGVIRAVNVASVSQFRDESTSTIGVDHVVAIGLDTEAVTV